MSVLCRDEWEGPFLVRVFSLVGSVFLMLNDPESCPHDARVGRVLVKTSHGGSGFTGEFAAKNASILIDYLSLQFGCQKT